MVKLESREYKPGEKITVEFTVIKYDLTSYMIIVRDESYRTYKIDQITGTITDT